MPESTLNVPITSRTIGTYLESLGSSAPTPGGGSAAGLLGALGASLGLMVISLTSTDDPDASSALREAEATLRRLRDRFTELAEKDERVYQSYRAAAALPRGTSEEKSTRRAAMQQALKDAASVPLQACDASVELAQAIVPVHRHGNPYLLSDARIASVCASACFEASRINVDVNLAMIKDETWVTDVSQRLGALVSELEHHKAAIV